MPLFELIKSMTSAEKKHFKLYAGTDENDKSPKYVELFDLIEKREVYDAKLVKDRNLANYTTFLYEKIDESLHVLSLNHRKKKVEEHPDIRLKWLLGRSQRLYDRGLWKDLKKCIDETKQLARKHELYLDWLEAIQWEKEWLAQHEDSKKKYERYMEIVEEEDNVRRIIKDNISYRNLRERVNTLRIKDPHLNTPEVQEEFKKIENSKELQTEIPPYTPNAKADFYYTKSVVSRKDAVKSYEYAKKAVDVFERSDIFNDSTAYRRCLGLLAEKCIAAEKSRKIPEIVEKIKSLLPESDYRVHSAYWHGLLYAILNTDRVKGNEYIKDIEKLLDEHGDKIRQGRQTAFYYNICVFHCLFGEWAKANKSLNEIFKPKRTDDRKDLQYGPRLLRFMVTYELNNDLDKHLQAITKYFKNHEKYTSDYEYIIGVFDELNKGVQGKAKKIITDLQQYLEEMMTNKKQPDGIEELYLWCKAKLQNTNMAAIIRQEQQKKMPKN